MPASVKQAVERVKAGDRGRAQQLLAEVLAREPDSEQAWLWLAYTLKNDARHFCLQQAQRINPNNQQVQHALQASNPELEGKLLITAIRTQAPIIKKPAIDPGENEDADASISPVEGDVPTPAQPIVDGDKKIMQANQYWLVPGGRELHFIILGENRLYKAIAPKSQQKEIVKNLDASQLPHQLIERGEEVPYDEILSVIQDNNQVAIKYGNGKTRRFKPSLHGC